MPASWINGAGNVDFVVAVVIRPSRISCNAEMFRVLMNPHMPTSCTNGVGIFLVMHLKLAELSDQCP